MPTYRVLIFNRVGVSRAHASVTADDDHEAIRVVADHSLGHLMELWSGERLVKRFEAVEPALGRARRSSLARADLGAIIGA